MKNPSVKEIAVEWLTNNGYDGLYNDDLCACEVSDLVPCMGDGIYHCRAGFKVECDGTCDMGKCDFHIAPVKNQ